MHAGSRKPSGEIKKKKKIKSRSIRRSALTLLVLGQPNPAWGQEKLPGGAGCLFAHTVQHFSVPSAKLRSMPLLPRAPCLMPAPLPGSKVAGAAPTTLCKRLCRGPDGAVITL